jgi:hypothetical protein
MPTIIDWKTGREDEDDAQQLVLYTIYAEEKWGWNPLTTRLQSVYLSPEEVRIETFTPTIEEIEGLKDHIKTSYAEMAALEPIPGQIADISLFSQTQSGLCKWCNFIRMCSK